MKLAVLALLVAVASEFLAAGANSSFARAPSAAAPTTFVYVKIPEALMPLDRGAKYEDPLDAALKKAKLGEVTGGGSRLSEANAAGQRGIAWIGIDVELADLQRGLPFLKAELKRLGAPSATTLEYTRDGKDVAEPI